ncbi:MAG: glycosyltransferase family 4 protein [Hyphomicrobiaceae bacterium]|nr:glycosyltransferase family 4 protein [Hyphomicrobiaceae bacterium]
MAPDLQSNPTPGLNAEAGKESQSMSVVIVTGAIAPYTDRLYNAVARRAAVNLQVLACDSAGPHRQWRIPAAKHYTLKMLAGLRLHLNYVRQIYVNPGIIGELWRRRPGLVIVGGFSPTMVVAGLYALARGIPLGIMTDGSVATDPGQRSRPHRWMRRLLIPRASIGLGASEDSIRLLGIYGLDPKRGFVVPIVPAWEAPAHSRPFEERQFDVMFCGLIDDATKGARLFGDVVCACKARGRALRVRVVGEGPLKGELEARLAAAGIEAQFDGYLQQDDLSEAYSSAKLLLFPTRGDAWGLVANEAILCGTPVIGSPHAVSSAELVERYEVGVVRPLEVEAWTDAVLDVLASRERWSAMQANGLRAKDAFSEDRAVTAFRAALEAATKGGAA